MTTTDLIGSLGVGLLLVAFLLQLTGKLIVGSIGYAALNLVGAGLACWASARLPYWPFVVLEGSWTLVSLGALVRALGRALAAARGPEPPREEP